MNISKNDFKSKIKIIDKRFTVNYHFITKNEGGTKPPSPKT
jgi:hypothetical protein